MLLTNFSAFGAVPLCKSVFFKSENSIEENLGLKRFEIGIAAAESMEAVKVTKEDFQFFSSREGSFRSLKFLFNNRRLTEAFQLWLTLEPHVFSSKRMETPEMVLEVEGLYEAYLSLFRKDQPLTYFMKMSRSKRKERTAKIEVIRILKVVSQFFSSFHGRKVDLLKQSDLLSLFEVERPQDLREKVNELREINKALNSRIRNFLVQPDFSPHDTRRKIFQSFFGEEVINLSLASEEASFFSRNAHFSEVKELLDLLRLEPQRNQHYQAKMEKIRGYFFKEKEAQLNILILFQAYVEVYGEIPGFTGMEIRKRYDLRTPYMLLRNQIRDAEYARLATEELYSDYLNKAEELNERLRVVREVLSRKESLSLSHKEMERVESVRKVLPDKAVRDFGEDIQGLERAIEQAEVGLDLLREEGLRERRIQEIEDFEELNNRWQRLIPNKAYSVNGIDYSKVVFTKNVIDHFNTDPMMGSRYLSALSKLIYVSVDKSSGLRALKGIHPQFRDIKIIGGKGKQRIMGKLIEGTIYFFAVYSSAKPYENKRIAQLVDHFDP